MRTQAEQASHLYKQAVAASELDPSVSCVLLDRAAELWDDAGDEVSAARAHQAVNWIKRQHYMG